MTYVAGMIVSAMCTMLILDTVRMWMRYRDYRDYRDSNNELHREDGPALIWINGDKVWWIHGERHREDGPAIIYSDDSKSYWLNDKRIEIPEGCLFVGTIT